MPGVQADMAGRGEAVSTMSGRVGGRMGMKSKVPMDMRIARAQGRESGKGGQTAAVMAERDTIAAELYADGKGRQEIAEVMGLDLETVDRSLQGVRNQWRDEAKERVSELRARMLSRLEGRIREVGRRQEATCDLADWADLEIIRGRYYDRICRLTGINKEKEPAVNFQQVQNIKVVYEQQAAAPLLKEERSLMVVPQ